MNSRARRGSNTGRQSSTIDANENKPVENRSPPKVLVFNGKCSDIFKSSIEQSVEDCVLEFPGQPAIYVSKGGQTAPRLSNSGLNSSGNMPPSARANRRRSSITQFNLSQYGAARQNPTNNLTLSGAAMTATSATRMRQQINQSKFTLVDHITEEVNDEQSTAQDLPVIESESEQQNNNAIQEEVQIIPLHSDVSSQIFTPVQRKLPSARIYSSYQQRQKSFRLSDLVMNGPEYYAHIFSLPRSAHYPTRPPSRQRARTARNHPNFDSKCDELERIKQDLFHRYLWTQKPQVSCRIRPISTYTRTATFAL